MFSTWGFLTWKLEDVQGSPGCAGRRMEDQMEQPIDNRMNKNWESFMVVAGTVP